MILQTAFFKFPSVGGGAKELNITVAQIRERFAVPGVRIINIETVRPLTFFGFQIEAGGLRVWYEAAPIDSEVAQKVYEISGLHPPVNAKQFTATN